MCLPKIATLEILIGSLFTTFEASNMFCLRHKSNIKCQGKQCDNRWQTLKKSILKASLCPRSFYLKTRTEFLEMNAHLTFYSDSTKKLHHYTSIATKTSLMLTDLTFWMPYLWFAPTGRRVHRCLLHHRVRRQVRVRTQKASILRQPHELGQ